MTGRDLIRLILDGEADDDLEAVGNAIYTRQQIVRQHKAATLRGTIARDDKVRLIDDIRPKYLAGLLATVQRVGGDFVFVTIDDRYAAGRYSGEIKVRLDLIEPA